MTRGWSSVWESNPPLRLGRLRHLPGYLRCVIGCAAVRKANATKRNTLLAAARIYQEFTGTLPSQPLPLDLPEVPRIGDQRYRIFHVLRQQHPGTVREENIAFHTGLTLKRISDQMRDDVPAGMIDEVSDGEYRITPAGLELMDRFETYKRNKGQPLPPGFRTADCQRVLELIFDRPNPDHGPAVS